MTDKEFNQFAKNIVSDKQYTDESILDYIKEDTEHYSNPRNIPNYPIDPYEWIHRVALP